MLYALFLIIAIGYNWRKFHRERDDFFFSLVNATSASHREMILGHHFHIFIFEAFLSLVVAHFTTERATAFGILGLGVVYVTLIFAGFFAYRFFVRYVEKQTGLDLWLSFKSHLIKELRVSFAVIFLPILIYSLINWTFQGEVYQEWGSLWFIGLIFNIIFVSVLTILCSVIIMLRLIPNREISEPEYLEIINSHLEAIEMPNMRIRWIETDIKNAFVVGLKLLSFSNQTMFIGRSLRKNLTMDEFEAVVAHELAHVANRHIHKRVIELLKNFITTAFGVFFLLTVIIGFTSLYWGEDSVLYTETITILCVVSVFGWFFLNYSVLFDTFRSHEYEADAYAVMVLGAKVDALESALRKLANTDELPEYIKSRTRKDKDKNVVARWFARHFATHPDIDARVNSLHYKIAAELPFNFYISSVQRFRRWVGHYFQWKVLIPMATTVVLLIMWGVSNFKAGHEEIAFINRSSADEIMNNKALVERINSRPQLVGSNLMAWIVKKEDPKLIDYFISHGADKGKTLVYLLQSKNFSMFKDYYEKFESDLTQDEYYLILRKSAQMNFTEGYRFLVNARQFEGLKADYKESVTRIHDSSGRRPASVK